MKRVLIIQHSSALDGSAHSGLLLSDGLKEAGWDTHVVFGFKGPIIQRYKDKGHSVYVTEHKNWLRRNRTHQFLKDVWIEYHRAIPFIELIQKIKPEIIYINTIVSLSVAIAAHRQGIPLIWHLREMFNDVGGEMFAPQWAKPFIRYYIRSNARVIVANSKATALNLMGKFALNYVKVVPNAASERFFNNTMSMQSARIKLKLPEDATIIGIPGTLRPMKGHLFFIRAIAPVLKQYPAIFVAVTGDGRKPYVQQIKDQIRALNISSKIFFLNWVDDMPAFYHACDIVCIPSKSEPFGRIVIEAFASGTPVVATAVGGIREIVDSGSTGRLVPYGNEDTFRRAITDLLDDPVQRRMLSENARQVAEKKYHEQVYKERIATLTEEVVTNGYHL